MCEHMVGHNHIRPDRLHQFFLGYSPVSIFEQIAQDLEGLWAQLNVVIHAS
jgi:hypothetical protein